MKTLIVSDVPFGYGSGQVAYLRDSLSKIGHEVNIICPSYESRPVIPDVSVEIVITRNPAFTLQGHKEFLEEVKGKLKRSDYNHIVIVNPKNLFILKYLGKEYLITYYGLETLENQFYSYRYAKKLFNKVDLAIFPESNRLERDERYFPPQTDFFLVFNSTPLPINQKGNSKKERDIIYAGNLDPDQVDIAAILELAKLAKVEVYGDLTEYKQSNLLEIYRGLLSGEDVMSELMNSRFSLVAWKPNNFSQRNASPNKLFQAISVGVPIISYPYPQAKEIVQRYGIGILAENFESSSLVQAGRKAMELKLSDYEEMSERALHAFCNDLNWENQISPYILKITGYQN